MKRLPVVRPKTRGECGETRPCPFVSCRYHLLLDVTSDGRLMLNRDMDENEEDSIAAALNEMQETCALDVAEMGGITDVLTATLLGTTVRRVDQIQKAAAERVRSSGAEFEEREHPEDFYIRYSNCGADELAEIAAELRVRKERK